MPYLEPKDKDRLLDHMYPTNGGELVYLLTVMALRFWTKSTRRFEAICTVIGALVCTAFEFYRRVAVPYENRKIKSNGDVYEEE